MEYLQAYIAECRAKEEKTAKEQAFAKQKEALKGKVTAVTKPKNNNSGTKSSAPAPKKNLTLELASEKEILAESASPSEEKK